jgi:hypothetical protein
MIGKRGGPQADQPNPERLQLREIAAENQRRDPKKRCFWAKFAI